MKHKILAIVVFLSLQTALFAQKIDKSKNELKSNNTSTSTTSTTTNSSNASRSASNSNNHFGIGDFFLELFFYTGLYTTIGDYRTETHLYNNLSSYPYADGTSGDYVKINDVSESKNNMRFDLENHFLYSTSSSFGNHIKAKWHPFQFFYVQGDYRVLVEKNQFTNSLSNLQLYHFSIAYDRLRFKKFNLGWTIGSSYIASDVNKAGFSYGLHAAVFAFKNMSFTSAVQWSKINGKPVNSFEFRGKYHKKNYFFSMGYENLKIASPNYNYLTLGGGLYF